ncbi:transcriptional regulator [Planotetraspora thailandica]|uniref:Transcriptional regulator n=1 Tax=Planotetraspora thailandica TaxID=487172 RepID=A0A8J3XUW8_9ACTN|nr:helix-turn-helix transcriptional regulator [Planotetraspora thailandica]GII53495.1 transcriptional regulator [Planotetraspora thailandica]
MRSALGEFLRARRQTMALDEAGLPNDGDRRRTPGLRRDEVALLAGVSLDYYTRLEQGKQRRPSDQVLDALAQAFRLDCEETEHLHQLARARPRHCGIDGEDDQVDPYVLRLLNTWDHGLANVLNRRTDVLARNRLSAALAEGFEHTDNFMRMLFLSPAARRYWPDWEQEARSMVAHLRAAVGANHGDRSLLELVEEVSEGSEDFRRIWARYDVRSRRHDVVRVRHPLVGEVALRLEGFSIDNAPGQRLFTMQAEPGSASEEALLKLSGTRPPAASMTIP